MKQYVYTNKSGDKRITVETDAFGSINNFKVIGVIGDTDHFIPLGFNLKTGDDVNIGTMLNLAKLCKAKLNCYEQDKLVVEESKDYSDE